MKPTTTTTTFSSFFVVILCCWCAGVRGARPLVHGWDTVADVLAMHGKYDAPVSDASVAFAAQHYRLVTTGTSCGRSNFSTIEEDVLATARRLKAANPAVKVGMYWRSDFALELADCSGFAPVWNTHPEWRLRDDKGNVLGNKGHYYIDYSNPNASAFFAHVLVNVTTALLPSGQPVLDMVYIDGDPGEELMTEFKPGIGPARSAMLVDAVYNCFADIQRQLDARGLGQAVILNGMDTAWSAARHVATGAAATMFDHWSILQFVNRTTGAFNLTEMDQAIALVNSSLLANVTVQVKGWPGPIVHQRDNFPPNIPQPKTPAEFQAVAAERFNSELALFLLVATENNFWIYSWFWGYDDYVPNQPDSSIPPGFFPEAACALGAPLAPPQRVPGTWTYRRQFEHASVFVDLTNRTNSRVTFQQNC